MSLRCDTGCFEFAKKEFLTSGKREKQDESFPSLIGGFAFRQVHSRSLSAQSPILCYQFLRLGSPFSTLFLQAITKMGALVLPLPIGSSKLKLPLRGNPINPYLRGRIIEILRRELKPKELRLAPSEFFTSDSDESMR